MEFNYLREKRRMLDSLGRRRNKCYGVDCTICMLSRQKNGRGCSCAEFETDYPEEATEIVRKWSKEHPVKTILHDLLEKYPDATLNVDGVPIGVCPSTLGYEKTEGCPVRDNNCVVCWNRPFKG